MKTYRAGFIGAGNMGGIIASSVAKKIGGENVAVCCSCCENTKSAAEKYGCQPSCIEDVCLSRYVFLGFKPQAAETILSNVSEIFKRRTDDAIVVSMLAGVDLSKLSELTGVKKIIRIMPNTPAAIGCGVTMVCANDNVSAVELFELCDMISLTGKVDVIPEKLFDAGTALSGCGPAYVYMFLEAMADGAVKCGFPRDIAEEYAARTLYGSAMLAISSESHTAELKSAVCSPGGSTIEGVYALEKGGFRGAVIDAVCAAFEKSKLLGK